MQHTFISKIDSHLNKKAVIKGWIYNKRFSGKIGFLQIRDGSGFIQGIVVQKDVSSEIWELANKITLESSAIIEGAVTKHPKQESYELQVSNIRLVQMSEDYPIGKKEHGPDFLLDNRHLWLRSSKQWAIQRVRNTIINATYEYLNGEGFIKIDAPILTPAACEGTTTLFEIEYFDLGKAYLSQSGQLYIEAAIMSHGRVFDFGPVFRAEKSKTRRHLTEFWMMDAEAAFVEHDENLKIQEGLVCFIAQKVLEKNQQELKILERDAKPLEKIKPPFYRITHAEAIAKLHKLGSDIKPDDDLGGDDETLIMKEYDKPLFIEKYPAKVKAFYMKRDAKNPELALCADMLAPEGFGEIIGGSQREDDYDALLGRIKEHKLPEKAFEWYLDLRKYGSVPHSGFGYGLERIVGWLCGTPHVRETIPFPRLLNRLYP
ncbi:MAG: asparagine--tRNA ligase [Deltaproteobacteria bacterium]|nr:asparagine--tRNA ligase [Deltaproteobacteria bacterium]MBI2974145.1 asparagine--tRNA ligase [Deltaproteobacteria bacterium]